MQHLVGNLAGTFHPQEDKRDHFESCHVQFHNDCPDL